MFAARKPKSHRRPLLEQNSDGKNSFLVSSLMSHDSLAELRNHRIYKQIYSLPLSAKQPQFINQH